MSSSEFDSAALIKSLPASPGVYQMYDASDAVLYVGKAKNLKNRVSSYFRGCGLNAKTQALVAKIAQVQVTITRTEAEALILEQNLIKSQRPPYNILLRDDKSYPYIFVSGGEYPRIGMHRGAQKNKGRYFGPFPNVSAVKESLNFLQKTFRVRQCEDSVFKNRSRPCLQYQIGRCTAPCVDYVSADDYAQDVAHTEMFLRGEGAELMGELADQMERCSEALEFERAAQLRDQIAHLRRVQSQQAIDAGSADVDIIAVSVSAELACVHILFVRRGQMLGSKSYFPKLSLSQNSAEVLASFMAQFYLAGVGCDFPSQIVVSHLPDSHEVIVEALTERAGRRLLLQGSVRASRAQWLAMAEQAAAQNLKARLGSKKNQLKRFEALQQVLGLDELPERLECFDISHSSGEKTVASCVVFDCEGPRKSDYRRFNIEGIAAGDDCAAMAQALMRRYTRVQQGEGVLPDILLVDGGKGQLNAARKVLVELGVADVILLGVAKGATRKAGFETLFIEDTQTELVLESTDAALHLIQHIRDESHRFAITGHKQRRDKARRTSRLEEIPKVGPKRRRELLRHFGGLQEIERASVDDLAGVAGISRAIAQSIYDHFHV